MSRRLYEGPTDDGETPPYASWVDDDPYSQGRDPARLGSLEFEYEQPKISVDTAARTVEHKLINDSVVVQHIGRDPNTIAISAICTMDETSTIDKFVKLDDPVSLRTERWSGDVIVTDTASDPMRGKDSDGNWLYDVQITCTEVVKNNETADSGHPDHQSDYWARNP